MGARAWVVLLPLGAAACLDAPPGGQPADGGACESADAGPRDPLLGNVLTYTFDGDDTATEVIHDRSGNRLDGALEGGSVQLGGEYGLCVGDNGSGAPMVELPSHPLLHLGSALTLEAWVYRTRVQIGEGLITIYDPVTGTGELIFEILPDDGLYFGVASGDCDSPVMESISVLSSAVAIGADEWVHLAVTWDGDHARFYRNGEEVYDEPFAATPCPTNRPLTLGATGNELLPLEGWLDDVKISSYAKTGSEIAASAAHDPTAAGPRCGDSQVDEGEDCEPPAPCCDPESCLYAPTDCRCQECVVGLCVGGNGRTKDGLVALYDFDEGEGTTATDRSGNGFDLMITGAGFAWGPNALTLSGDTQLVASSTAEQLVRACQESQEVSVEAWVTPSDLTTAGQTLSTLGFGDDCQAFSLTQQGDRLTAAVSTGLTERDGEPFLDTPVASIEERLTHVVLTRSADGWRRLYLHGRVVGESRVAGDLSSWDVSQRITVGGPILDVSPSCETGQAGFWQGQLHQFAVYSRALSPAEVAGNYQAGAEPEPSALR
jgi:hypothetical protein